MANIKTGRETEYSKSEPLRRKVAEAVKKLDAKDLMRISPEWRELRDMSDDTSLQGIGADPVGIDVKGMSFEGLMTVHLLFDFSKEAKPLSTSSSVSGSFTGHFQSGKPKIDSITLDMRPFYVRA